MNRYKKCRCSKRKTHKTAKVKKIGISMLLLGSVTVMFLILSLKCWVILLSIALIVFGILLLKH